MWEVAELEVYGEGYVPRAFYQSQVLDLGAISTLGTLRWIGFKDDDARVEIRTRSGSDLDPDRYWRFTGRGDEQTFLDDEGQPLTRTAYQSLSFGQGPITPDLDHWSDWSGGYSFADSLGTPMTSPGPQRFVQLQVAFATKDGQAGGLELVEFLTSQPPDKRSSGRRSLAGGSGAGPSDELCLCLAAGVGTRDQRLRSASARDLGSVCRSGFGADQPRADRLLYWRSRSRTSDWWCPCRGWVRPTTRK